MGVLLHMSLLVATLCVLQVYAGYEAEEDEYKRALEELRLLQREQMREEEEQRALETLQTLEGRKILQCKKLGEGCRGIPKCCGSLHCYWKDGYSMRRPGECVECIQQNQQCQRNAQCCTGLQCEKGNGLWVDGRCQTKRSSGHCYQDSQCEKDCKKKWWKFTGECE